eukprot:scaffold6909_cov202-Prasinococcus_capsulatus_cf.AAC.1
MKTEGGEPCLATYRKRGDALWVQCSGGSGLCFIFLDTEMHHYSGNHQSAVQSPFPSILCSGNDSLQSSVV